jgi:glycosyltransferase involved in cell wall biosynthesis
VRPTLLNRFVYAALTGVIVNSQATAASVLASGALLPARQVHVLYNGVDADAFDARMASCEENAPWTPRAAFPGGPLVIGNAGRLTTQKGQKYLLHMSATLHRRQFPHRLVIAGGGELEAPLRALADALGLTSDAAPIFAGFLPDLSAFWRSLDLFVLSSLWEGFGYVLADAMLAGKPLLAFDANSMPELVVPGRNGVLAAPPGERESDAEVGARLAQAVMDLAEDPARMCDLGKAGRLFCREHFGRDLALRRLKALLFDQTGEEL